MKKLLFLFAITAFLISCGPQDGIAGKWTGNVLMVNVEYDFKSSNQFSTSTFSSNGIQVGGGLGSYYIEDNILTLEYEKSYFYNSDTEQGEWDESGKTIQFTVDQRGNLLTLTSVTNGIAMELQKK